MPAVRGFLDGNLDRSQLQFATTMASDDADSLRRGRLVADSWRRETVLRLRQATRLQPAALLPLNTLTDASSLTCKHKFPSLTDKCRRYTRRNFSVLTSQNNSSRWRSGRFRNLSQSID
jgi:hypothetical protein